MTFDFHRWRDWLRTQEKQIESVGIAVQFKSNDQHLPSFSFSLKSSAAVGSFRGWQNALVDYEVISIKLDKLVANEAMIKVDDSNFETVFAEFRKRFNDVI